MKRLLALTAALFCWGCSTNTQPVLLIGQYGQIFRGTTSTSFSSLSLTVSDGFTTCNAARDGMDSSPEVTMALVCSDGRRGIATMERQGGAGSGGGTVRFTDGVQATFIYGPDAKKF